MLQALLGRKIGMTQIFTERGNAIPVTVIEAGPCVVTQLKTQARDGYEAVQIGFGARKTKNVTRPELGHLGHALPETETQRKQRQQEKQDARQEARARKAATPEGDEAADEVNLETQAEEAGSQTTTAPRQPNRAARRKGQGLGPFELLREVEAQPGAALSVGQTVDAGIFRDGEFVDIIGTSKGKGFTGVMKRHGFHGGQRTHGQSDRMRAPGSIGAGTTPGRVFKGTRMAGHMGHVRRTVKQLEVVQADAARNLIVIRGSVPGPNGGVVLIRKQQVEF
jgi:large subunit ribosomal protein L3